MMAEMQNIKKKKRKKKKKKKNNNLRYNILSWPVICSQYFVFAATVNNEFYCNVNNPNTDTSINSDLHTQ